MSNFFFGTCVLFIRNCFVIITRIMQWLNFTKDCNLKSGHIQSTQVDGLEIYRTWWCPCKELSVCYPSNVVNLGARRNWSTAHRINIIHEFNWNSHSLITHYTYRRNFQTQRIVTPRFLGIFIKSSIVYEYYEKKLNSPPHGSFAAILAPWINIPG